MAPFKNALYRNRIFRDDLTPPKTKNTRPVVNMTKCDTDDYPFNRDALASTRLNLQHKMWIDSNGYHLHPDVHVPKYALIADIGCGTGIWAVETAGARPECQVEGTALKWAKIETICSHLIAFDLSLAQAPPKEWCPSNVTFSQLDILGPIPAHMQGRYDVAAIRLFLCVVQAGDPMPLLQNLLKSIKPGGHVQWQEIDPLSDTIIVADPSASAPKLQALRDSFDTKKHSWIPNFNSRFGEASATLVAHEKVWTKKACLLIKQDIMFPGPREWCENLKAKDLQNARIAGMEKLVGGAEEECWTLGRGSDIDSEMVTWVVRKQ